MVFQSIIVLLIELAGSVLGWIFSFVPIDIELPVAWVPFAKGLLDWSSYFFPVEVLYEQASILFQLLGIYLIIKVVLLIKKLF